MKNNDYFVEKDNNLYYVYNDDPDTGEELVFVASSIEELNNFSPGLGDLQENLVPKEKEFPKNKRGWDPDEYMKKVVKYYKDWAGFNEDEVLTEDLLKNEDWRLKRVSSLKNVPVKQLKSELLKQKDSK